MRLIMSSIILALALLLASCKGAASSSPAPAWVTSTLAGTNARGDTDDTDDRPAQFFTPTGVAADSSGNVYVADQDNHLIRKITPAGAVSTLAGRSTSLSIGGLGSGSEDTDPNNPNTVPRFNYPTGVAVDSSGNVYVADRDNHRIRKITSAGVVSTLAGSTLGHHDDTGTAARFNKPTGVTVDSSGNVYVADRDNHCIRRITPAGKVDTLAGSESRVSGLVDGTGAAARFNYPTGVAVNSSGNAVYVADKDNHCIREITITTQNGQESVTVSTLAGSRNRRSGFADGTPTAALFNFPSGVAVDSSGNVYVADYRNHRIRRITVDSSGNATGVSTIAGSGTRGSVNGQGTAAQFDHPYGVDVDSSGNIYVGSYDGFRVRKIEYRVP